MKKKYYILVMAMFLVKLFSLEITGIGISDTEDGAKKAALQDLSLRIEADVQTEVIDKIEELKTNGITVSDEYTKSVVNIKSEIPLYGYILNSYKKGKFWYCDAKLSTSSSLNIYSEKLKEAKNEIDKNLSLLKTASGNRLKIDLASKNLTYIKQFYKLKTVVLSLGGKEFPEISTTEEEMRSIIMSLEGKADDIQTAVKMISDRIKDKKGIYVFPPTPRDSHEITQFAGALKYSIENAINAAPSPDTSTYYLKGKYEILKEGKEGIDLVYSLVDKNSNNIDSFFIRLAPSSFQEYEIFPKTTSFDKLLHEGLVVSNDFKIDINTNRGKNDLLFSRGETVKLLFKLNRAGYYYIVGHVVKDDEKYSYLLDVNDADGASKFVSFINQDDANKWIEIGEFSVEPPFGVESLQIIASNKDLKNGIPNYKYDDELGYYFISKDPEKGAMMTRGLKKVDSEKNKSLTSEAVLFMTTMDK